jgi:hypothetical protein
MFGLPSLEGKGDVANYCSVKLDSLPREWVNISTPNLSCQIVFLFFWDYQDWSLRPFFSIIGFAAISINKPFAISD